MGLVPETSNVTAMGCVDGVVFQFVSTDYFSSISKQTVQKLFEIHLTKIRALKFEVY